MVVGGARVKGLDNVLGNLNKEVLKIRTRTKRGVKKAGLFIQREAQKIVPVDTGNLKAGAFTEDLLGGGVVVGFSAAYAIFVHEDMKAKHKEGKSAKFLEKVVNEKMVQIIDIIALETKI